MNHQPFETWVLSGNSLAPEQAQELREHLQTCEGCQQLGSSWSEVQRLFQEVPAVGPERGFTLRWHGRLAVAHRKRQRKQTLAFLALSASTAVVLFLLLFVRLLEELRSPEQFLLVWVYRMITILARVNEAQVAVRAFFGVLIRIVPLPFWIGLFWVFSILSVLWFVLYRKIITQRRIEA